MHTTESEPGIVIPLAHLLFGGEAISLDNEREMEATLTRIFGGQWGPGWNFDPYEQSIDVWRAAGLPEYVEALIGVGFALVRIHAHGPDTAECSCTTHWSKQ